MLVIVKQITCIAITYNTAIISGRLVWCVVSRSICNHRWRDKKKESPTRWYYGYLIVKETDMSNMVNGVPWIFGVRSGVLLISAHFTDELNVTNFPSIQSKLTSIITINLPTNLPSSHVFPPKISVLPNRDFVKGPIKRLDGSKQKIFLISWSSSRIGKHQYYSQWYQFHSLTVNGQLMALTFSWNPKIKKANMATTNSHPTTTTNMKNCKFPFFSNTLKKLWMPPSALFRKYPTVEMAMRRMTF